MQELNLCFVYLAVNYLEIVVQLLSFLSFFPFFLSFLSRLYGISCTCQNFGLLELPAVMNQLNVSKH